MRKYEVSLENAIEYWKDKDKCYIATYNGERLRTKQAAYFTQSAVKKAVADIIKKDSDGYYLSHGYQQEWSEISKYVKSLIADGVIQIVDMGEWQASNQQKLIKEVIS